MLRLEVNISGAEQALAAVGRTLDAADDRAALHLAMAMGVELAVKRHLRESYAARSPRTGFYGRMAQATAGTADQEAGAVTVGAGMRGAALRYFGGTVAAGKTISSITGRPTRLLAIPTKDVPAAGAARETPANMGILKYLPSKKGGGGAGRGRAGDREARQDPRRAQARRPPALHPQGLYETRPRPRPAAGPGRPGGRGPRRRRCPCRRHRLRF